MLPDPLDSALPGIIRRAAAHVVADAINPQLLRDHAWPIAERPHVTALAFQRGTTDGLNPGCHRLRGGVRT